jgi:hypothetical protein
MEARGRNSAGTVKQWSAGGVPIKPGLGLDGVEKPSPAMKDFDFVDLISSQEPKASG